MKPPHPPWVLIAPVLLTLGSPALGQPPRTVHAMTHADAIRYDALHPDTLQMEPRERRFFALGVWLARGAFAYAELAKGAGEVAKTHSKLAQVGQLGHLEPTARRDRLEARDALARAVALLQSLDAPASALAPVRLAAGRLAGGLPTSSDARPLTLFNARAARTLSSLSEFETLSSLPEDPALRAWLDGRTLPRAAAVWYDEGAIAGLAQIAARHQMPALLPPAQQVATDLRGLRDWLALRLPDAPTPEQAALRASLDAFLKSSAAAHRPGVRSSQPVSAAQLAALGEISRRLRAQVLGPEAES